METWVEDVLTSLIEHQQKKVMKVAREVYGPVTPEDLRNPQDLPLLYQDPLFQYEDGILAGYLSAQMALRARHFQQ